MEFMGYKEDKDMAIGFINTSMLSGLGNLQIRIQSMKNVTHMFLTETAFSSSETVKLFILQKALTSDTTYLENNEVYMTAKTYTELIMTIKYSIQIGASAPIFIITLSKEYAEIGEDDGTLYDLHKGILKVDNKTRIWLEQNGWKESD